MLLYHAVLAPRARWRQLVVNYGRMPTAALHPASNTAVTNTAAEQKGHRPRYWTWAALMRRAVEIDVLACPRGGGRARLIATVAAR